MDVIIEIQHAVNTEKPRGVGNYAAWLTGELIKHNKYEYGLSFFKNGYEQIDRLSRARQLFGDARLFECDTLSYSDALRKDEVFAQNSYEDLIGGTANLFHFMNIISVPTNINAKMLVTVHDLNWIYYDEACSPVIRELVRIGWNRVKKMHPFLIAVSENTKREILDNSDYEADEIAVIYHGYNALMCYPDNNKSILQKYGIGDNYLFFVGVFERKKNILTIIKAFNILAEKYSTLKLVLAGQPTWDNSDSIYAEINSSPFANRIITLGYISDDDKRVLYSNAALFMFPSICEGLGLPIIEAFACGCPVVTSNHPTMTETGGKAVLSGDAHNARDLADKAEVIIRDGKLRQELIKKGFERTKLFTWEKTVEQVECVYSKILGY